MLRGASPVHRWPMRRSLTTQIWRDPTPGGDPNASSREHSRARSDCRGASPGAAPRRTLYCGLRRDRVPMAVSGVRVLVPPEQHRDEHAREHHHVLDRQQRVEVVDKPRSEESGQVSGATNALTIGAITVALGAAAALLIPRQRNTTRPLQPAIQPA